MGSAQFKTDSWDKKGVLLKLLPTRTAEPPASATQHVHTAHARSGHSSSGARSGWVFNTALLCGLSQQLGCLLLNKRLEGFQITGTPAHTHVVTRMSECRCNHHGCAAEWSQSCHSTTGHGAPQTRRPWRVVGPAKAGSGSPVRLDLLSVVVHLQGGVALHLWRAAGARQR